MNKIFFILLNIFLTFNCFAKIQNHKLKPQVPAEICPDVILGFENIQIQQLLSSDGRRCYLSLHPRDVFHSLIYRDYLLTDDGLLFVFNSYSQHEGPGTSGAREFYFLPNQFEGFSWKTEGDNLVVFGFVGKEIKFSLKTAQITSIAGTEIQVSTEVSPNNKGGLEIMSSDFSFVDAGFKMDDSPSRFPDQFSFLRNSKGESCKIKNQKIYLYNNDAAYLLESAELAGLANKTCPGFKF